MNNKHHRVHPTSILIPTHNPNMFLLWGKNAAQSSIATGNEPVMDQFFRNYDDGVYFHYNYWCNVDDPREQTFCQNILNKYKHEAVYEKKYKGYKFILYRLEKK